MFSTVCPSHTHTTQRTERQTDTGRKTGRQSRTTKKKGSKKGQFPYLTGANLPNLKNKRPAGAEKEKARLF